MSIVNVVIMQVICCFRLREGGELFDRYFHGKGTIHFRHRIRRRIVCAILNLVVCFMCRGGKYMSRTQRLL